MELAVLIASTVVRERAATAVSTDEDEQPPRVSESKQASAVALDESAVSTERAAGCKRTVGLERAVYREGTVKGERAVLLARAEGNERAVTTRAP